MRQRTADLYAFAVIVAAAVTLIAVGLPSDQIVGFTSAVAILYTAWRQGGERRPARRADADEEREGEEGEGR
ncbi:hypothetical protein ACFYXL_09845 [Streptomyces tsukubensis]|uniref:hypothetical protein n=1 Tax=Streptomyces tsukubensis TaxID=83656 RepID=UPI0036A68F58